MDKVTCRCGVKGEAGSKCRKCSASIPAIVYPDPDPAFAVPEPDITLNDEKYEGEDDRY
jgi:hypothetical protein